MKLIVTLNEFKNINPQENSLEDSLLNNDIHILRYVNTTGFISLHENGFPIVKKKIVSFISNYNNLLLFIDEKEKNKFLLLKDLNKYILNHDISNEVDSNFNNIIPIQLNKYSVKFLDEFWIKEQEELKRKSEAKRNNTVNINQDSYYSNSYVVAFDPFSDNVPEKPDNTELERYRTGYVASDIKTSVKFQNQLEDMKASIEKEAHKRLAEEKAKFFQFMNMAKR